MPISACCKWQKTNADSGRLCSLQADAIFFQDFVPFPMKGGNKRHQRTGYRLQTIAWHSLLQLQWNITVKTLLHRSVGFPYFSANQIACNPMRTRLSLTAPCPQITYGQPRENQQKGDKEMPKTWQITKTYHRFVLGKSPYTATVIDTYSVNEHDDVRKKLTGESLDL